MEWMKAEIELELEEQQIFENLINNVLELLSHWSLFERLYMNPENRKTIESNPAFFNYLKFLLVKMIVLEVCAIREKEAMGSKALHIGPVDSSTKELKKPNRSLAYLIYLIKKNRPAINDDLVIKLDSINSSTEVNNNIRLFRNQEVAHKAYIKDHYSFTYDELSLEVIQTTNLIRSIYRLVHIEKDIYFEIDASDAINYFHEGPPPNFGTLLHMLKTHEEANEINKFWGRAICEIVRLEKLGVTIRKNDMLTWIDKLPDEFSLGKILPELIKFVPRNWCKSQNS